MNIAVDFDGTIVEDNYPNPPINFLPGAKETLMELSKIHTLHLWTLRRGQQLDDAIRFLQFHEIRMDYHGLSVFNGKPPVHLFIEDKVPCGFIGWNKIREHFGLKAL